MIDEHCYYSDDLQRTSGYSLPLKGHHIALFDLYIISGHSDILCCGNVLAYCFFSHL